MGKRAKTSRKGKKAWRANISTEDIDDFYEKSTKDALSGGSLSAVPSESLFFVDKSKGPSFLLSSLSLFFNFSCAHQGFPFFSFWGVNCNNN